MEDITALATVDASGRPIIPSLAHSVFVCSIYGKDEEGDLAKDLLKSKAVLVVFESRVLCRSFRLPAGHRRYGSCGGDERRRTAGISSISLLPSVLVIDVVVVDAQMSVTCLDIAVVHDLPVEEGGDRRISAALRRRWPQVVSE